MGLKEIKEEIMNSKDKKLFFKKLKEQWNTKTEGLKDKVFLKKSSGKIFIMEKEAAEMLLNTNVKVYSYGNYFGTDLDQGFRPSVEGSQILGHLSSKNIIELDDEEIKKWVSGLDIEKETTSNSFVIIKNKNDFYGSGKAGNKMILNYLPKSRRIKNFLE